MELNIKETDKFLIVSPHQDDETIGCGGLLAKYGKQCDVLLLTDGKYELLNYDVNTITDIRNKEFEKVTKKANVNSIHMMNIENEKVRKMRKKIIKFDITPYDYIFVPNKYETHIDHKCVLSIFKFMKIIQRSKAKIFEYEVWTPLRYATWIFNIDSVIERKKNMIEEYKSQLTDRNYVASTLGLNAYRGMMIKCNYAEAYCDASYDSILRIIYDLLPNKMKLFIKRIV